MSIEVDTLTGAWKRIVHKSMFMPQLKWVVTMVDKVEFQPKPTKFYVAPIISVIPPTQVVVTSTSIHSNNEVEV